MQLTQKPTIEHLQIITPTILVDKYLTQIYLMPDERRNQRMIDRKAKFKKLGKQAEYIAFCTAIAVYTALNDI